MAILPPPDGPALVQPVLIRHSLVYVAAKVIPGAIGMLTTLLLTRLLAPAQYGIYGLALVLMSFGSTFAFDWLGLAYLRVAQVRRGDPRVKGTIVALFCALVLLTGLLALAGWAAGYIANPEMPVVDAPVVALGIVLMWSFSWFELVARFAVADFRPGRYLVMNAGRAAFILAGAGSAAWWTGSPLWTAAGTAAGTLAGALLGGFAGWGAGLRQVDGRLARTVMAFGLPLAVSLAMSGAAGAGTRVMVRLLGSDAAMGLYTAGFMLVQNTLGVVAAGIASAGYSLAVRAVESGDAAAARRQLEANGTLLLAVLAPAALGMGLTAHGIGAALVGPAYAAAVTQLTPWMAAAAFFAGLRAHYLDHAFQLGKRPALQIQVTALAAFIALGLSLWLIPLRGPAGAAMAVTAAMAVSCVHAVLAGRLAYALPLPWDGAWRIAVSCGLMAGCVLLAPGGFLVQVAAGGSGFALGAVGFDLMGVRGRKRFFFEKKNQKTFGI